MSLTSLPVQRSPETYMTPQDYDAIEGAVMETVRGRWFLMEFARRNRACELGQMRDALVKLERTVLQRGEARPSRGDEAEILAPAPVQPAPVAQAGAPQPEAAHVVLPFAPSPPPARERDASADPLAAFDAFPEAQRLALFA